MSALVIPNTFVPATVILSAAVNANFAAVVAWATGGIQNDNLGTFDGPISWTISSNALALDITSTSITGVIQILHTGVLQSNQGTVDIDSNVAQTAGHGLLWVNLSAGGSTMVAAQITNAGTGDSVKINTTGVARSLYINDTGAAGTAKAAVQVDSTTRGSLLPRLTTTQRNAITSPPEGLEIYNTVLKRKEVYNGSYWVSAAGDSGRVVDWPSATVPPHLVECYGQTLSSDGIGTYDYVISVVGTVFGSAGTVPDLRGCVVAGEDDMGGTSANRLTGQPGGVDGDTLGAGGGLETHTLTDAQLSNHNHSISSDGSHSHTINDPGHSHSFTGQFIGGDNNASDPRLAQVSTQNTNSATTGITINSGGSHTHGGVTGTTGSNAAHNNVQPTVILKKCIVL